MFPFTELLEETPPRIKVVDVGALPVQGLGNAWDSMLAQGLCEVVGFEPIAEACAKLNAEQDEARTYLPYAIADGKPAVLKRCNYDMTSSLLEPNTPLLEKFVHLEELTRVVAREPIETHRLDDIEQAADMDFLKLDVQGSEVVVIENATRALATTVVVETEVEFVPL